MNNDLRIIISGGGTGGHIFPAVSIANAIKAKCPDAKILFVGALGRMEMQRVPAAGYDIKGLPICGFDRKHLLKNISVMYKIWKSQRMAKAIIRDFKPMVAVGVGGYASGPTLNVCAKQGIPCLIQEQNSYAGVTNRLLSKKSGQDLRGIRWNGTVFPSREDRHDWQSSTTKRASLRKKQGRGSPIVRPCSRQENDLARRWKSWSTHTK